MKTYWLYILNTFNKRNKGQSMVEYVLIISLIAIVLIVVVTNFGDALLGLYENVKDALLDL